MEKMVPSLKDSESRQVIRSRLHPPSPVDALHDAAAILKRAEELARENVKHRERALAKKALATWRNAKERGYEKGYRDGQARSAHALLERQKLFDEKLKSLESDCIELAYQIARKVLENEMRTNRAAIAAKIRRALKRVSAQLTPRIEIAASDLALRELLSREFPHVGIQEHESISPGCARIATACGAIEINWKSDLSFLQRSLRVNTSVGNFADASLLAS